MMKCPDGRRITLIEYRMVDGVPIPFTVCSRGLQYDFEWSRAFGLSYHHMSACGYRVGYGKTVLGRFLKVSPRQPLWFDPSVIIPAIASRRHGWEGRVVRRRKDLWNIGYKVIKQPLAMFDESLNPFEWESACDGECAYCHICHDWFPDYRECEHLWWCDDCGMMSGVGSDDPCNCVDNE
mgnify:FL=1